MSTYTQILYQIVFGSKNCTPFLTTKNQENLFNYIAGIARNKKCIPYSINGHRNHLHLVVYLHPSVSLADLIRDIKKGAHDWMLKNMNSYLSFPGWQVGYAAFTYDCHAKSNLINYVNNQAVHHKKLTFQKELIRLLEESGINYELRYLLI
jgi:putative transposase